MFLFFHLLYSNVPDNKCHKQKWFILFFTHIKLVTPVPACVCMQSHASNGQDCLWNISSDIWLYFFFSQLLEFFKAPFLVLQFPYYTLMTYLMILCVILLSILMILLSILSVTRHLICGSNWNWLLKICHLNYETLWTEARSGLLISMQRKFNWFCLNGLTTLVLFLRKNNLLRCWGCPSLLNWIGDLTLSLLLKLPPRKLEL